MSSLIEPLGSLQEMVLPIKGCPMVLMDRTYPLRVIAGMGWLEICSCSSLRQSDFTENTFSVVRRSSTVVGAIHLTIPINLFLSLVFK